MTIGELARESGVKLETIRYYERIGLLPKPPRSPGGYRLYEDEHCRRLIFIRRARALGFALDQVGALLDLSQKAGDPCGEVVKIAQEHLAEVRRKLADLSRLEAELGAAVTRCASAPIGPQCPVLQILVDDGRVETAAA